MTRALISIPGTPPKSNNGEATPAEKVKHHLLSTPVRDLVWQE